MDKRQTQLRMAIIGLGRRSLNRGLKEIVKNESFELVAACDPSQDAIAKFQEIIPDIPCFESLDELLKYSKQDNAYIAVPHSEYSTIIPKLLEAGIHVLKEKPAGTTVAELHHIQQLAFENGVRLLTAAQTRHGPYINQLRTWLPFIGTLYTIEGTRKMDVSNMGEGWRAKAQLAGGGVLNDLGWHLLDTVLWLSGTALKPNVAFVTLCNTRGYQGYDCEDTAHLIVELQSFGKEQAQTEQPIVCNLKISRVAPNDTDEIVFNGSDGILLAREDEIELQTMLASRKISQRFNCTKAENFKYLLDFFAEELATDAASEQYKKHRIQDKLTTMLIHDVYAKSASKTSLLQDRGLLAHDHYVWPKITEDVVDSVSAQMKESLSIYDDSGVFREFEVLFKEKHNRPEWYSLLHNSGSNALQALYYAAGLMPGDEVIFPVYTFHATCSPAMHFGIKPVFCDVTVNGNIDPIEISKLISKKTKAIVVTHMWGVPCEMTRILSILKDFPSIFLLEDCSHAHGATVGGQPVGTFGDGAAWSLQGQKIVSGGEGGITLTKYKEFQDRQLLWGHYNKRCKSGLSKAHPLREYALTGAGLKNRAHPLAVAIAANQLRKLLDFLQVKQRFATKFYNAFSKVPFLQVPDVALYKQSNPCQAFMPSSYFSKKQKRRWGSRDTPLCKSYMSRGYLR